MEPTRDTPWALADLLDRVRDRGIRVEPDVVVSVADIPLITVNLKAALVGIETVLRYGMTRL